MDERWSRAQWESQIHHAMTLALDYEHRDFQLQASAHTAASVLLLVGFDRNEKPYLLYTRRTDTVEKHKGQMSFPGGHREPEDIERASAALREAQEEVGISPSDVQVCGYLPSLSTGTGFLIDPVVAILTPSTLEQAVLRVDPNEVAEALWISVEELLSENVYRLEHFEVQNHRIPTHVFQVRQYRIWGATGAMTKNLLTRLSLLK